MLVSDLDIFLSVLLPHCFIISLISLSHHVVNCFELENPNTIISNQSVESLSSI